MKTGSKKSRFISFQVWNNLSRGNAVQNPFKVNIEINDRSGPVLYSFPNIFFLLFQCLCFLQTNRLSPIFSLSFYFHSSCTSRLSRCRYHTVPFFFNFQQNLDGFFFQNILGYENKLDVFNTLSFRVVVPSFKAIETFRLQAV